jgi:hypothetical protein
MLKADRYKKDQTLIVDSPKHYYVSLLNLEDEKGKKLKRCVECAMWNSSSELSKYKINITEEDIEFNEVAEYLKQNSEIKKMDRGTLYIYKNEDVFNKLYKIGIALKAKNIK